MSSPQIAQPTVDIIIPTYNNLKYLKVCIASVRRNTRAPYTLIVVDSGDDDTYEWLRVQPDIVALKSPCRLHFAAATNAGIRIAKGEYLVMLNNDTIVADGWLDAMMQEATRPGIGAVGPFSNNDKNWRHRDSVVIKGKEIGQWTPIEDVLDILEDIEAYTHAKQVSEHEWISFYATLFPRRVVDEVGLLDDGFRSGYEDMDYCRRIRLHGYKVIQTYDAFVFHFVSKTIQRDVGVTRQQDDAVNKSHYDWKYAKPMFALCTAPSSRRWSPKVPMEPGSQEDKAVQMALEISARGYRSFVFADCEGMEGVYDGIAFRSLSTFEGFLEMNPVERVLFFDPSIRDLPAVGRRLRPDRILVSIPGESTAAFADEWIGLRA
jgi:GT2 family glycosyltransferase